MQIKYAFSPFSLFIICTKSKISTLLSAKAKNNELIIVDGNFSDLSKTKTIKDKIEKLELNNSLIVNNFENNNPFVKAAKNLKNVEFLKADGINVYDILNNEKLVITKDSLNSIVERCQ